MIQTFLADMVVKKLFAQMRGDIRAIGIIGIVGIAALLSACSAEVGSRKWCEKMQTKPEGEWTITEAKDYAKNCLFK